MDFVFLSLYGILGAVVGHYIDVFEQPLAFVLIVINVLAIDIYAGIFARKHQ